MTWNDDERNRKLSMSLHLSPMTLLLILAQLYLLIPRFLHSSPHGIVQFYYCDHHDENGDDDCFVFDDDGDVNDLVPCVKDGKNSCRTDNCCYAQLRKLVTSSSSDPGPFCWQQPIPEYLSCL